MGNKAMIGLIGILAVTLASCATSFQGSPYVENGRAGCDAKCKGQGMEVAGMVYMGEYSSACVCAVPGQAAAARQRMMASAAAATGGAVGVVMQQRRSEEQRSHSY